MIHFKDDTSYLQQTIKFNKPKEQIKNDDEIDKSILKDLSYDQPKTDEPLKDDSATIGKWETVSQDDEMYRLYYYNQEIEDEEESLKENQQLKRKYQHTEFEKEDIIKDLEVNIDSFKHNKEKVSNKYKKIDDDKEDNDNIEVEFKKTSSNKKRSLRKRG